ncbi:MAG: acyl carrier protein [Pseudomonadota bacterium]|nr:acyl carrier protein [Pseudomonadota bacterium]
MVDRAELIQVVREAAADALAIDPAQVGDDANLHELGAQSLEFLDIVFKLEQRYDIEITRGEMERAARGDLSEEVFAPSGEISPIGLDRLRELMPESAHRVVPGLRVSQILSLFTVGTFVRIVETKLGVEAA